jgi:hypothetical protein
MSLQLPWDKREPSGTEEETVTIYPQHEEFLSIAHLLQWPSVHKRNCPQNDLSDMGDQDQEIEPMMSRAPDQSALQPAFFGTSSDMG